MTIELTETSAMREAVQMMDVLTRLRLKGFKLSIDDFGTGYSSLVQLQKMPFSELKIDKSFVMQMSTNRGCRVIVEIVIDLAHKLGLSERRRRGRGRRPRCDSLIEMGCDMAQGYHVSPPGRRPTASPISSPAVTRPSGAARRRCRRPQGRRRLIC